MKVTLHQGDCLEYLKTLNPSSVNAIITDPPYGARRPSARRTAEERFAEVEGNEAVDVRWLPEAFRVLVDGGAAYVFACWDRMEEWKSAMQDVGFRVRSCIVWDKGVHGLADLETCWAPQHEFILFGAKGRHVLRGRRPKDVLRVDRVPSSKLVHPYQKPVGLMEKICASSCDEGDTVLDPYMGSGATGMACVRFGLNFIGCEVDPKHFKTAERRIEEARPTLFAAFGFGDEL